MVKFIAGDERPYDVENASKIYEAVHQAITDASPKNPDGVPEVHPREILDALQSVAADFVAARPDIGRPQFRKRLMKQLNDRFARRESDAIASGHVARSSKPMRTQ
jgi:hypothetical protein